MIRHVVCFKLKEGASAEEAKEMLLSMRGREETALSVEVGIDGLHSPRSYDLILIVTLALYKFDFLTSTQLLWINLITDSLPVLSLGAEKEDADSMLRPPERASSLLSAESLLSDPREMGRKSPKRSVGRLMTGTL